MDELQVRGMKSDPSNSPFRSFRRMVFSVADHRVVDGGKLHPDLVLQSGLQRHLDERSRKQRPFHGVPKFSPSRFRIALRCSPLEHTVAPKIMNQGSFSGFEMSPNHCEIASHRSMAKKLPNQRIAIPLRGRKEQNARRKAIDAMNNKDPSPGRF